MLRVQTPILLIMLNHHPNIRTRISAVNPMMQGSSIAYANHYFGVRVYWTQAGWRTGLANHLAWLAAIDVDV
jgi:hypothetical protein